MFFAKKKLIVLVTNGVITLIALQFSCLFGSLWPINAPEPVVEPEGCLGSEVESHLLSVSLLRSQAKEEVF